MIWVIGIVFGIVLAIKLPDLPFLGAVILGVIIVWFGYFIQNLFGLNKNE